MNNKLTVVSGQSNLAIKQVEEVISLLDNIEYKLIPVNSFNDNYKDISLLNDSVYSNFPTRELYTLLLDNKADIAIHSVKYLPYPLSEELEVIALTSEINNTYSLVCRVGLRPQKLSELPSGAIIGVNSTTKKKEMEFNYPKMIFESIRGTVEEQIQQMDNGDYDAIVVETCALKELGLGSRISETLSFQIHPLEGALVIVAKKGRNELIQIFKNIDVRRFFGKAYLLGAGPGSPDLMTIRGRKILESADIIYYDDLIDKSVLEGFANIESVYVGKRKSIHTKEQTDINNLMINSVYEGKKVVRLKGGDPMIFAHGGEEVESLQRNLIEVEVVPGISTANAVASLCKIPLTHREIASSLAFVSGHALHGLQIPNVDSLVFYMAGTKIKTIAKKMTDQGWDENTPVALVYNVSMPDQKEFFYTLKTLSKEEIQFPMPIIIIIGKVVELRRKRAKEINSQQRILVTGLDKTPYKHLGKIIHTPLIETQPIDNNNALQTRILNLSEFDHLLFTSKSTVYYFFEELQKLGKDSRILQHLKIFSIGQTTSKELTKYGIIADYQAVSEDSEGVIDIFQNNNIKGRVLIPRSDLSLEIIPKELHKIGLSVETVVAYRNTMPKQPEKIDLSSIDTIVFTSPSCINNFLKTYSRIPENKQIIVRGSTTYKYLRSFNFPFEKINTFDAIKA